jgi:AcrR family transcriptional regulator
MEEIARHTGVGIGTLYRHFPTKDDLLAELFVPRLEACADEAAAALHHCTAAGALRAFISAVATLMADDPGLAAALADPTRCTAHADFATSETRLMDQARDEGALRPDLTPTDLRALIRGMGAAIATGATPGLAADILADGLLGPAGGACVEDSLPPLTGL